MADADRQYDLVAWGATGVAGGLVAEYLAEAYAPETLSLALGGRSRDRLESLAAGLGARHDTWDEIPIVVGDATDPGSLREIAESTHVVCTTVGPYTEYGTPLVEACLDAGTDYCDLTGEINWIRGTIDRYHEEAVDAGVRIVRLQRGRERRDPGKRRRAVRGRLDGSGRPPNPRKPVLAGPARRTGWSRPGRATPPATRPDAVGLDGPIAYGTGERTRDPAE